MMKKIIVLLLGIITAGCYAEAEVYADNIKAEIRLLNIHVGKSNMSDLALAYGVIPKMYTHMDISNKKFKLKQACIEEEKKGGSPIYIVFSSNWGNDYIEIAQVDVSKVKPSGQECIKTPIELTSYLGVGKNRIIQKFGKPIENSYISEKYNSNKYLSFEVLEYSHVKANGSNRKLETLYAITFELDKNEIVKSYTINSDDEYVD